jgi:hypothetical protein
MHRVAIEGRDRGPLLVDQAERRMSACDVQHLVGALACHADPKTTLRYDRCRRALNRHATYAIAHHLAGGNRTTCCLPRSCGPRTALRETARTEDDRSEEAPVGVKRLRGPVRART